MPEPTLVPSPSGELLTGVADGVAHARLNRPRAINALTATLVAELDEALRGWFGDASVQSIELDGAGERGLCAGADVRAIRQLVLDGDLDAAEAFFRDEYAVIGLVAHAPKPVTARQTGIVMGGGLGLSAAAQVRVASADATFAMPETGIGFAPDAGAAWFLARAGRLGLHLALTGASGNAADALAAGLTDQIEGDAPEPLFADAPWLEAYDEADPVAILAALDARPEDGAHEAAALLRTRSPLGVWTAFRHVARAQTMSWPELLRADLHLAHATLRNPDFVEGVRAQLVDKDRTPRWRHASLEDVTPDDIAPFLG